MTAAEPAASETDRMDGRRTRRLDADPMGSGVLTRTGRATPTTRTSEATAELSPSLFALRPDLGTSGAPFVLFPGTGHGWAIGGVKMKPFLACVLAIAPFVADGGRPGSVGQRKDQRLRRLHQPALGACLQFTLALFQLGRQERPDRQGADHLRHLHHLRHVGLPARASRRPMPSSRATPSSKRPPWPTRKP